MRSPISALLVAIFVPRRLRAVQAVASEADATGGPADGSPVVGGFRAGLRFVVRSPLVRSIVLLVTLTNAIDSAGLMVLKPLYATEVLGDPGALGFMVGCFAAGALTGSAVFAAVGHRWSGRVLFAACFMLAGTVPYATMALDSTMPATLSPVTISVLRR